MKARKKRYCFRCGTLVRREKEKMEDNYPWYCPCCDENMFNVEVYKTNKKKKKVYKANMISKLIELKRERQI